MSSKSIDNSGEKRLLVTRREVLGWFALAASGALVAKFADVLVKFFKPRAVANEFGSVFNAGTLADLPSADMAPANFPEGKFYLVNTEAGLLALYKVCTHLDCLLHWDDQANAFVCPCHGSQFAKDGKHLMGPATRSLDRFPVQILDAEGQPVAATDLQTGRPLSLAPLYPTPAPETSGETGEETEMQTSENIAGLVEINPNAYHILVDTGSRIKGNPV